MKQYFLSTYCAWCLLSLLVSCQILKEPPSQHISVATMKTNTPMVYELAPNETMQSYPLGGSDELGDLLISTTSEDVEEYVDASGNITERWIAGLWIGNEQCPPARAHMVHIGDTVEFGGYRFRVLDVSSDNIIFAMSETASTSIRCEENPYNNLPGETLFWANLGSSHLTELIGLYAENPRIEKYTDKNEVVNERWAAEVRLNSKQLPQIWEGTVYVGDSIEFAGYRIGILDIDATSLFIAYGPLNELQSTPAK